MARDGASDTRVIVLCRMLFTQSPSSGFRPPRLGGASFLGDTQSQDWPLEPIDVVDGVPFLITRGYTLAGVPESDARYLAYCETDCHWSNFRYTTKTELQKREALSKLLSSPKWRRRLNEDEQSFLAGQIN